LALLHMFPRPPTTGVEQTLRLEALVRCAVAQRAL
jgi:hypothetical protein